MSLEARQTSDAMTQLNEASPVITAYWSPRVIAILVGSMLSNKNFRRATLRLAAAGCRLSYDRILSRSGSTRIWSKPPRPLLRDRPHREDRSPTPTLMSRMQMLPAEKMLASRRPRVSLSCGHVAARHTSE